MIRKQKKFKLLKKEQKSQNISKEIGSQSQMEANNLQLEDLRNYESDMHEQKQSQI